MHAYAYDTCGWRNIEIEYMSLKSLTWRDIYVRPLIHVRLRPLLLSTWKKQYVKQVMLMLMLVSWQWQCHGLTNIKLTYEQQFYLLYFHGFIQKGGRH